jgi:phenylacetate-CoA ligase
MRTRYAVEYNALVPAQFKCERTVRWMFTNSSRIYGRNWRVPAIAGAFRLRQPEVLRELDLIHSIEQSGVRIQAVRDERLARLLHHAWSQTEYYHEVLEECGAVRNGKVYLDRFEEIPFLTKGIIRAQGQRLLARTLPKGRTTHQNRSSGTTGDPVHFWQDNVYWDATIATRTYHFGLCGKLLGDREMKVWGSDRDLFQGTIGFKAKLENWLYNRRFEQCFHLPEERIRRIIKHINQWRPTMLWCYRDGIYAIAQYINEHGLQVHSPAAVVAGGSTVYPFIVDAVSRAFGAPTISAYGSREIGAAACECQAREGHHIAAQSHVLEVIGADERPVMEQDGELAVTPLLNYAMPFIRYRIGDRGRLTGRICSCGRKFPLMDSLSGRVREALTNSKGEHVDSSFITYVLTFMADRGFLRQFQVIQEEDGSITINVVPEPGATLDTHAADLQQVIDKIQFVMGRDCPVRFVCVEEIPFDASGKYPYVICRHRTTRTTRSNLSVLDPA